MAAVTARYERTREMRGRTLAQYASRAALFDVLCRAIDALQTLPDDLREPHADIMLDAFALGWRPIECDPGTSSEESFSPSQKTFQNFSASHFRQNVGSRARAVSEQT